MAHPLHDVGTRVSFAERLAGPAVFFAAFAVYLLALAPSVTFWDSGELILGAFSLGLPHPPAYPVFCVLGKAFTLLPIGAVAYRINLMSASFGAGVVWMLFVIAREMGGGGRLVTALSASAALSFGFLGIFWGVCVEAEVYTGFIFIMCTMTLAMYRRSAGGGVSWLYVAAFFAGLAFASHQSALFMAPALAVFVLTDHDGWQRPRELILACFFFLAGLAPLLYPPVRASRSPLLNIGNPVRLDDFLWVTKLSQNLKTLAGMPGRVTALTGHGWWIFVIAALVVLAAFVAIARRDAFISTTGLAALGFFVGIKALTAGDVNVQKWGLQSKFYAPAALFFILFALCALYRATPKGWRMAPVSSTFGAAFGIMMLIPPALIAYNGWSGSDNSRNWFARDFAADTLKSVAEGAALFGWGDNGVFPVWYLQGVERYRDDVFYVHSELLTYRWAMSDRAREMYDRYGLRYTPRYGLGAVEQNVTDMAASLAARAPVYYDFSAAYQLGLPWSGLRPQGLVHMAQGGTGRPQADIWDTVTARSAFDRRADRAFAVEGVLDIYAYQCQRWGLEACGAGRVAEANRAFSICGVFNPAAPMKRCTAKGK